MTKLKKEFYNMVRKKKGGKNTFPRRGIPYWFYLIYAGRRGASSNVKRGEKIPSLRVVHQLRSRETWKQFSWEKAVRRALQQRGKGLGYSLSCAHTPILSVSDWLCVTSTTDHTTKCLPPVPPLFQPHLFWVGVSRLAIWTLFDHRRC